MVVIMKGKEEMDLSSDILPIARDYFMVEQEPFRESLPLSPENIERSMIDKDKIN